MCLVECAVNFSKQMRNLYLLDGETGENIPQQMRNLYLLDGETGENIPQTGM